MFEHIAEKIAEMIAEKVKSMETTAYTAGYEAGYTAHALKDKEDQNRRLQDMYRMGKERGREEAHAEIGQLDQKWFDALTEMAEEEAEARKKADQ